MRSFKAFNDLSHPHSYFPFLRLSREFRCPHFSLSQSQLFSSDCSDTFMEVVKAVAKQGSAASQSVAIRADQKSYSYVQLISAAQNISDLLRSDDLKNKFMDCVKGSGHLGGARIGIVAKPSAEFVASVLGTWFSGGVAVPLALGYPEAELLHVMNDSDISMILSTEEHSELMQSVAGKTAAQFSLMPPVPSIPSHTGANGHSQTGDTFIAKDLLRETENLDERKGVLYEDPALIVYTSGTTGKPKGVVHTHKGIKAQVQMLTEAWEYTSADQLLHCLPLHHILVICHCNNFTLFKSLAFSIHVHGLFNVLLAPLYAGSTVEFLPKFSVRGIWQRWRESYPMGGKKAHDAITVFTGVPTMYTRLIQGYEAMDPESQAASASAAGQLRLMMCGSSALPYPVMQQWETITGHRLLERYGMTEFVMAISNPLRGARKGGTVGKPFPGVEAKILAEDESGSGEGVGELCIRSPSLFKEYWKLPEVTKGSFIDGGFFKTGDAVKVDEDGYYVILGRKRNLILCHPAVSECCVLGLPDKDYGEAVSAIVVPEADAKRKGDENITPAISLQELCDWAKDKLAPYKLPTRLLLWESLPRNAMGKVNKKELKRKLAAEGL
ncbi:AMP-binding enzyme, C-terminal domain [Dillenia turbinata]|uniref:AMP-binding enzyme, C-terminal domain n=1 Tax=Dillenia turbinata TaxID=194707 RepID=A0AAN8U852_9MAGN